MNQYHWELNIIDKYFSYGMTPLYYYLIVRGTISTTKRPRIAKTFNFGLATKSVNVNKKNRVPFF